uniref:ABI family member 3 binding protein n=1 Tax=Molossus molossus TaxID=27622 RepID=A0A7J8HXI0_MOLMO|nr:ABI family member 3 binding protein [Molossus molossus]
MQSLNISSLCDLLLHQVKRSHVQAKHALANLSSWWLAL